MFDAECAGGAVKYGASSAAHVEESLRGQKALGAKIIGFAMVLHDSDPIVVDENTLPGLYPALLARRESSVADELFRLVVTSLEQLTEGGDAASATRTL